MKLASYDAFTASVLSTMNILVSQLCTILRHDKLLMFCLVNAWKNISWAHFDTILICWRHDLHYVRERIFKPHPLVTKQRPLILLVSCVSPWKPWSDALRSDFLWALISFPVSWNGNTACICICHPEMGGECLMQFVFDQFPIHWTYAGMAHLCNKWEECGNHN